MSTQKLKNRWLIAASAVGIHISIGSVYAYSVMTNPVKDVFVVDGSVFGVEGEEDSVVVGSVVGFVVGAVVDDTGGSLATNKTINQ